MASKALRFGVLHLFLVGLAVGACSAEDPAAGPSGDGAIEDASDAGDASSGDAANDAEGGPDGGDRMDARDLTSADVPTDVAEPIDSSDDGDTAEQNDLADTVAQDSTEASDTVAADAGEGDGDLADGEVEDDGGVTVPLVVNSLEDLEDPPEGTVTLRAALAAAASGQPIHFDPSLDGGTISLSIVGEAHTVLRGEVMGMRMEPSGPVSYLVGYFDRDYGRSALYARKHVIIDASSLPSGITLAWAGGRDDPARVLAVYGVLEMTNVTVTGGYSVAEALPPGDPDAQPWTLARGGGLAVWGRAHLEGCTLYDNHCEGDFDPSRDRGAFGGGLYADIVELEDSIVSGNTVLGGGAAGGGVYSVGGAESRLSISTIDRSAVTGNRISGVFAYGAGVYSDGGSIGNAKTLELTNTTVAWNVAEPAPGLPPFLLGMGYWRGGGIYMSNGSLSLQSCTVAENEVYGVPRTDDLGKRNLAGGIAATIGNAHAVEDMTIGHSIIVGNRVYELGAGGDVVDSYPHDIFSGSLFYFNSLGYNRIGVIDFSQILVPVGEWNWRSLCRKHYPKVGDEDGVALTDVLDRDAGTVFSDTILSAGVAPSAPVVLHYTPRGTALDQVPTSSYVVWMIHADYTIADGASDDFLAIVLGRIEDHYGLTDFAGDFTDAFEAFLESVDLDDEVDGAQHYTDPTGEEILTLADTQWFGPAETWPKELANYPYIEFWHRLDDALAALDVPGMGPELLGDAAWSALFPTGRLEENPDIYLSMRVAHERCRPLRVDQLGSPRPAGSSGDIGAIELP